MKRFLHALCLLLLLPLWVQAQTVTSNPTSIVANQAVTITFKATSTSNPLYNFEGDVYMYTGVNTNVGNWQYVIQTEWLDNNEKGKMTKTAANTWTFTMPNGVRDFYGVADSEQVKQIALVVRDGEGNKGTPNDVFLTVTDAGLYLSLTPASDLVVAKGDRANLSLVATSTCTSIRLLLDDAVIKSASNTTYVTQTNYTFANEGTFTLKGEATSATYGSKDRSVKITVLGATQNEARPAGVKDGINIISPTEVTFVLYAPNKGNIVLIGDFNDWTPSTQYMLKKDGNYWWYTLTNVTPGQLYRFQYLVDGNIRLSDAYTELVLDPWNDKWINENYEIYPNLPEYPEGKTSELVATFQTNKPAYNWEVPNFTMPPRENMIIYELLLRDFTTEKSLEAAIEKLDYLKDLGITAIELMPIQEFDGNNSWGYNPNHFFAPDKAYGTPDMYKRFIDECHKRGMAVLLDVVFNHATGIHPFAKLYWNSTTSKTTADNPWFNVDAPHPYSVFHDFNHTFSGTKEYFNRVLQYWITEYKVDGYRLDLTKGFTQTSSTENTASNYDQSRIDILTGYYNATKEVKSDVMFILEHFCADSEERALAGKGMYLWRMANKAFRQSAMGYQAESDFSGMNSSPRNWVGFAESHDEERAFYEAKVYGGGDLQTNFAARMKRVPLNMAFTTLIPGPKMIWQFGEMGYDYSILYNGDRTAEKPSAFTEDWLSIPERKEAYEASSKIITLRKMYPTAFMNGTAELNIGLNDWNNGRRIAIKHSDLNMVTLGNFTVGTATTYPNFPNAGTWYELLTGEQLEVTNTGMTLSFEAGEVRVYTDRKIELPNSIGDIQEDGDWNVTITDSKISFVADATVKDITVYNMQGLMVAKSVKSDELNITGINSGYYIVKVQTSDGNHIKKFMKK